MELIANKTRVQVYHKGEYLFEGIFVGFGIYNLGLNGREQGILVLAQADEGIYEISVQKLNNVIIMEGD